MKDLMLIINILLAGLLTMMWGIGCVVGFLWPEELNPTKIKFIILGVPILAFLWSNAIVLNREE